MIRLAYLLEYPVDKITGYDSTYGNHIILNSDIMKYHRRRKAITKYLVPSIMTMLGRIHSITADEIPNFKDYDSSEPLCCFGKDPIESFIEWKDFVKKFIEDHQNS